MTSYRFERCAILCARLPDDAPADNGDAIRVVLNSLDTDDWWFVNPGTFIVAFLSASAGMERAKVCEAALRKLADKGTNFPLGLGISEGEVACERSAGGGFKSIPKGTVVNEAMNRAIANTK